MTLALTIIMATVFVPFILRPKDFIFNFQQYLVGLASYLILFPVFKNVIQVYSICNLHDISWGNGSSVGTGTNALTQDF